MSHEGSRATITVVIVGRNFLDADLGEELAAARLAGLQVVIAVRSDLPAPRGLGAGQIIRTFEDLG